jgi:hypothetical protein
MQVGAEQGYVGSETMGLGCETTIYLSRASPLDASERALGHRAAKRRTDEVSSCLVPRLKS